MRCLKLAEVNLVRLTYSLIQPVTIFAQEFKAEVLGEDGQNPYGALGSAYRIYENGAYKDLPDIYRNTINWLDIPTAASIWGFDGPGHRNLLKSKLLNAIKGQLKGKVLAYQNMLDTVSALEGNLHFSNYQNIEEVSFEKYGY